MNVWVERQDGGDLSCLFFISGEFMSIEHKLITDPNIHDPKGYAAALTHQSPHKAPDGLGGHNLRWTYGAGIVYGEMDVQNNVTAKAMTAAVDPTLNTNSDY